jgi:predicted nucleotidyltransferase
MRTTAENRFLSVRVPAALRRPLKELAARQQTSVQQLVRRALEELLREADKSSPGLTETLGTLRAHADDFRRQGVRHLYLFGSVARGDARPTSDIDIAVDIDPDADFSLLDLIGIQQMADELLGWPTDVVECRGLKRVVRRSGPGSGHGILRSGRPRW